MFSWPADPELNELIQRYYAGDAGLWNTIRTHVDEELRRRKVEQESYHLWLRGRADGSYDIVVDVARP